MERKKFLQLQKKWDQKLAKAGFEDIEDRATGLIKDWDYSNVCYDESYEEYFRLATEYLHATKFKNKIHQEVWRLHSEGTTQQDIAKKLRFKGARNGRRLAQLYLDHIKPGFNQWCFEQYGYNLKKANIK